MKPHVLKTASQWRKEFPGARALILMPVSREKPNASFLLHAKEPAPMGKFRLLGTLD
jgi:hypothetical protein